MTRTSNLLSFYFLVLYIYSAASCTYLTMTDWAPFYLSSFPLLLSFIVAGSYKVWMLDKKLLSIISVLVLWNGAQYYINHIPPSPYALMLAPVCWVAFNVFHDDFSDRYLRLSVILAYVTFFLWVLSLLEPSLFDSLGQSIGLPSMSVSHSFILFNKSVNGFRNCGTSWEPGRYSCMLMLALYFYYISNGFKWKDHRFIILLISLISTVSTTGIFMFFILIVYHLFNKKRINPFYWIPLGIVSAYVWSLPFMSGKFEESGFSDDKFQKLLSQVEWSVANGAQSDGYYTPQRFHAFAFQWMNIEHMNPIIGDSHNFTKFYINKELGFNIVASEGILFIIICYGVFIGFWCYWCLYKSSKWFGSRKDKNYVWLLFVLFLLMNFSYHFWEFPIFMTIWLWSFFDQKKVKLLP